MGHVDHGKTTILDYMRKSSVAAGEAGGITQHIGAFSVPLSSSGKTITFLDTPGHAAFLAMRQRGANVTDIVILVVAADDSVKPQTLEAIKHAKSAGVPIIVAINKVDKEEADVQRVKHDLARHGIEIEDFGGDTQVVCVSGKTGQGMDELEEAAVTLSDILDHRAAPDGPVEGWILEATTKKAGRVATVLVRRGTLRKGSIIVAGKTWTRVRSLKNEAGVNVEEVSPGMPVEVDGWREQPIAGDEVLQAPDEQKATTVVENRMLKEERQRTASDMEAINEFRRLEQEKREREKAAAEAAAHAAKAGEEAVPTPSHQREQPEEDPLKRQREVPFIIKADVSGSAEALESYILTLTNPMVTPSLLSVSIGQINETDIELAAIANGHIISFNLPTDEGMNARAEARGVKIFSHNIIYRVLDDVKEVLESVLPPIITQRVLGEAEIAADFDIGLGGRKKLRIAGCRVKNGLVSRGTKVRVMRGQQKVYDGTITSLKNVKKDVTEMRKGSECGMGFDQWEGFEVGDTIQTYEQKSEPRRL
ncbi:P-loop containing nucleoside triphosphate hydrolase protein [Polychaeton citri CBS 116435]|uniref:Translation initiation factor IF-2, mitochondrial n=1 Tax=Polychaeton citri CBS 116435 TaxID=1314669 RepID=A0A9P4PWG2_9PEZI|nr:P-loop containing nucleoside triphosphate hydrolase protein [Polychaeton citri CBS 116435]